MPPRQAGSRSIPRSCTGPTLRLLRELLSHKKQASAACSLHRRHFMQHSRPFPLGMRCVVYAQKQCVFGDEDHKKNLDACRTLCPLPNAMDRGEALGRLYEVRARADRWAAPGGGASGAEGAEPDSAGRARRCGAASASPEGMPHRTVRDAEGVAWEVWEVRPAWAERRVASRREEEARAKPPAEHRSGRDRRQTPESRPRVGQGLESGWLVFSSAYEKRRLAPIPPEWESLADETLVGLSANGTSLPKPRRRLIE